MTWHLLGFNLDDVLWLDREGLLVAQCVELRHGLERPSEFVILKKRGYDQHMTSWFVSAAAAEALDRTDIPWREFLRGEVAAPPADAVSLFTAPSEARRSQ